MSRFDTPDDDCAYCETLFYKIVCPAAADRDMNPETALMTRTPSSLGFVG
jgi:hypothetical protein